jgi:hypothetical protein
MSGTIGILVRAVMKTFAGWLVAKAFADQSNADMVANGVGAGILILLSLIWSHVNLWKVTNPLPSPKQLSLFALGIGTVALCLTGCTTALQSDKIMSVKQRCFGLVVETVSTTSASPNVKLGFVSTVWQIIPTCTNGPIFAPQYMDTFDLGQEINPFGTSITENTGSGSVMLGTNGEASAFAPK